jgi:predicted metal-dependent phosphoesterase TrpH
MNVDLHCHSTISDGLLQPSELVERARLKGVDMLALTDHDETSGLAAASARAAELGLRFIPGVEISVSRGDHTIHIVGLGIDPANALLAGGLARIRETRDSRALKIAQALEQAGVPGALEGALRYAGNPALISRVHFARFLVEQRYVRDVKGVFNHYLVPGKPGYVAHQWASLQEAVQWIRAAGGMAVIAHPGRCRFGREDMRAFLEDFHSLGGEGIEVVSGSHTPEQYREFAALAREYGLRASRASDFHGPRESRADLGSLPGLPPDSVPVWQGW